VVHLRDRPIVIGSQHRYCRRQERDCARDPSDRPVKPRTPAHGCLIATLSILAHQNAFETSRSGSLQRWGRTSRTSNSPKIDLGCVLSFRYWVDAIGQCFACRKLTLARSDETRARVFRVCFKRTENDDLDVMFQSSFSDAKKSCPRRSRSFPVFPSMIHDSASELLVDCHNLLPTSCSFLQGSIRFRVSPVALRW
jgi:hypothetical protein